jgi:hypothetical protein
MQAQRLRKEREARHRFFLIHACELSSRSPVIDGLQENHRRRKCLEVYAKARRVTVNNYRQVVTSKYTDCVVGTRCVLVHECVD